MSESLWGDLAPILEAHRFPADHPFRILSDQATSITEQTAGRVEGRVGVNTVTVPNIRPEFYMDQTKRPLPNHASLIVQPRNAFGSTVTIAKVAYPDSQTGYPCRLARQDDEDDIVIESAEEFRRRLGESLQSDRTADMLKLVIARSA